MSHDNRFSKTNYLKTNLLKQIKKYFHCTQTSRSSYNYNQTLKDNLLAVRRAILIPLAKLQKSQFTPNNFAIFASLKLNKYKNRGNSLRITPICYFYFAKPHPYSMRSLRELFSFYIMPPIPGAAAGAAGAGSGLSTNTHSVVRNRPAIEAAFSKATRSTLAGSTIPALRISS